jgi:hypothetical protein
MAAGVGVARGLSKSARWRQGGLRFEQLDPIAEWIVDEDPVVTFEFDVLADGHAGAPQVADQILQVIDDEGGVRLARRREFLLDSEMRPSLSNQHPPRAASSGGFTSSGIPRRSR